MAILDQSLFGSDFRQCHGVSHHDILQKCRKPRPNSLSLTIWSRAWFNVIAISDQSLIGSDFRRRHRVSHHDLPQEHWKARTNSLSLTIWSLAWFNVIAISDQSLIGSDFRRRHRVSHRDIPQKCRRPRPNSFYIFDDIQLLVLWSIDIRYRLIGSAHRIKNVNPGTCSATAN
jgi:hypothetical protein